MEFDHGPVAELETLLETERALLFEGDLKGLRALLPTKEKLVSALLRDAPDPAALIAPLAPELRRNQDLLQAAMKGIQAVSDRMSLLKDVHGALETYDAFGRRLRVAVAQSSRVEKRA